MTREVDCQVFQDQLDALSRGSLPQEGIEQLRLHAGSCADCGVLLEMYEHLASPSKRELEAAVPDVLVDSVWPRVQAEIAVQGSGRLPRSPGRRRWSWLVPALAAASVALLIGSGLLLGELRRMRDREGTLVQQIAEHERRLSELESQTARAPFARIAGLAGRRAWERVLSRRERVTISDLSDMLSRTPSGTTLFGRSDIETLVESLPFWMRSAWRKVLEEIRTEDGVQAGELLQLLEMLEVDPQRSIPTARILALSKGTLRPERS